eukprot:1758269-Alexandrium_andersonii.AAC.1
MVLTVVMVLVRRPRLAQTRSPKLSRGAFCANVRAGRKYVGENLPRTAQGLVLRGCSRWSWRWC